MRTSSHGIGGVFSAFPNLAVGAYQRSVVWTGRQRALFVQSVLKDYPTGIIVLNKLPPKPIVAGLPPIGGPTATSHDIIDGQQRLTTLSEFLENPLIYITEWIPSAPKKAGETEPEVVSETRSRFSELLEKVKKVNAGYAVKGTRRPELVAKLVADAKEDLQRRRMGYSPKNPAFKGLIDALERLYLEVTQRQIVVGELEGWDTAEAEQMYHVINTSGTELLWWELLRVDDRFTQRTYARHGSYITKHDALVRLISNKYRVKGRLKSYISTHDSFWEAMFALGENFHFKFAGISPSVRLTQIKPNERRLKVEGLGFRLVSTFLSHDVGGAAISKMPDQYSEDDIRKAIDALFDAGEALFDPSGRGAPQFSFLFRYSQLRSDSAPAYPLIGIIVSAAKMIAINQASGKGRTLTVNDTLNLRGLTEELMREAICTPKWAGTGDRKLGQWLDDHFIPMAPGAGIEFPGSFKGANTASNPKEWIAHLDSLRENGHKSVDKKSMILWIWTQYVVNSLQPGSLPRGEVEFDHIVPFQDSPGSLTTHPLNFAAVPAGLNRSKGKHNPKSWAPSSGEAAEYSTFTLNKLGITIGSSIGPNIDFLQHADYTGLSTMILQRKQTLEFVVRECIPSWIANGD